MNKEMFSSLPSFIWFLHGYFQVAVATWGPTYALVFPLSVIVCYRDRRKEHSVEMHLQFH